MMDPDMRLLAQVIFSDRLQAAEKERARQRSREGRIRRPLNVRGRVGAMLVAVGQRLQTLDSAHAEPTA